MLVLHCRAVYRCHLDTFVQCGDAGTRSNSSPDRGEAWEGASHTMELSGQHRFSAPRARVWRLLRDPTILQQCLPGAENLVEVGPDEYEARMKIGVAAIRGTYQGRVKIQDKDEPNSYRMAVEGKGPAGQIS